MSKISSLIGIGTIFFVSLTIISIIFPSLFSSVFGKFSDNLIPYEVGTLGVPEFDDLTNAVNFIHDRLNDKEPVMVHCLAGLGRTGTILACYLIKYQKMSADDAIQKVREERPGSIQSFSQEEIIFQFEKSLNR